MASPAFIYAFDLLGPERFAELCALLLAARYRGFLLGGVGPDQGVDAVIDPTLGTWTPDTSEPLLDEVISPGQTVVFQFKHKVVGRVGEAAAREQLLRFYRGKGSELRKPFVKNLEPSSYVLVTNVEVTEQFRQKFATACTSQRTKIQRFQIVGLDELETWVRLDRDLRTLYFPALFGPARFNLHISVMSGEQVEIPSGRRVPLFQVKMANIGAAPSYIASIILRVLSNDQTREFHLVKPNADEGPLEPGRARTFHVPYDTFSQFSRYEESGFFPAYIEVVDEIGNVYEQSIPRDIRERILQAAFKTRRNPAKRKGDSRARNRSK